jgi:hypothetical protein
MVSPTVTELPRKPEPAGPDTFIRDLNDRTTPQVQGSAERRRQ